MPLAAPRPCRTCGKLTTNKSTYCDDHLKQAYRRYDSKRPSSSKRGYGGRWQQARLLFLSANPLCVNCKSKGIVTLATVVDHIQPHKGDYLLMWDQSNWQALCKPCHDSKTATHDGGFGR